MREERESTQTQDMFDIEDYEGQTLQGDYKGIGPGTGTTDNLDTSREFLIKDVGGINGGPFSGYENAKIEQDGEIKEVHSKNLKMIVQRIVQ